ncbi:MAG: hypothetical protein AVDCRST_MAG24-314, partial [uncultured Nocardioidaceae bacterium]
GRPPAAPAAAQPAAPDRRPRGGARYGAGRPLRRGRGRVRRLRHLRRARRRVPAARLAPAGGAALLRPLRRPGRRGGAVRGRARHLPAHRLPRAVLRPHGPHRARARPVPRAARHLLRALPTGGVAATGPASR